MWVRNLRKKNILWVSSLIPLLFSMVMVQVSAPQTVRLYVDPKSYKTPDIGATFTINVIVNVTDPDPVNSPPDGLWGFEYKLKWDDSILNVVSIQYHVPPGWTSPFLVANNDTDLDGDGVTDGHLLSLTTLAGTAFTGVTSLCTYTFQITGLGDCALDIYDDKLVDDTATLIPHTTDDGYFSYIGPIPIFSYSPDRPIVNETVIFDASASYSPIGNTLVNYTWSFGDGNLTTTIEAVITHTYTASGSYNVTLAVTDNQTYTGTALQTITVRGPPGTFFSVVNIVIVVVIALFSVLALYYVKKRILR